MNWDYDSLGRGASGKRCWQHGTPVAGQQFEYTFDDIGNLKTAGQAEDHDSPQDSENTPFSLFGLIIWL